MFYQGYERKIAGLLDRFPRMRSWLKWSYQHLAYVIYGHPDCPVDLNPAVIIGRINDGDNQPSPKEMFFGYYDKCPWDPAGNYFLVHRYDYGSAVELSLCDLNNGIIRSIGESRAFNFQQGCMLSWVPGYSGLAVYNDLDDNKLIARIVNVFNGKIEHQLPMPIQCIHPSGREALTLNYLRLAWLRPEYGYRLPVSGLSPFLKDDQDGIWKIDLLQNLRTLLISLDFLKGRDPQPNMLDAKHKVNHLLYSPSGTRFAFLHRWIGPQGKFSRLYTANSSDGSDLFCLADERMVSHYAWLDDNTLLAWARKAPYGDGYILFQDRSPSYTILAPGVLDIYGDGHPSFSPDRRWLVTDTYPDKGRRRHLLLFNLETGKLVHVGSFFSPWRYDGARRCDLHPRWHPDGTKISIDSTHEGYRNTYIIDVGEIVRHGGKR